MFEEVSQASVAQLCFADAPTLHCVLERQFAKLEGLIVLSLATQNERLHRLSVSMAGMLSQDLVGRFEAFLILFRLVVLDNVPEQRSLFRGQLTAFLSHADEIYKQPDVSSHHKSRC